MLFDQVADIDQCLGMLQQKVLKISAGTFMVLFIEFSVLINTGFEGTKFSVVIFLLCRKKL